MKEQDKKKDRRIINNHSIKSGDDFSWGGNTLEWEKQSLDVASRYKSYKGRKKYTLK